MFPRDGEGAYSAGAQAGGGMAFRVIGDFVGLANFGKYFVDEKSGILIAERVVFEAAIQRLPCRPGCAGALVPGLMKMPIVTGISFL